MASLKKSGLSGFSIELIQGKNIGHLATLMKDGWPQVTPVWVDHEDGKYVLVNTAEGRTKVHNVIRDPRVAISIVDMSNPFRMVAIKGKVTNIIMGRQAEDHIDKLAKKYTGQERYQKIREENRLILKIKPEHEFTRAR